MVCQPYSVQKVKELVDASMLLREGIRNTPGLELVGDSWLNVIVFTVTENPNMVSALYGFILDAGWHIRRVHAPPAIQVCLTNAMAVRVHELMALIQQKFVLLTTMNSNAVRTGSSSAEYIGRTRAESQHDVEEEERGVVQIPRQCEYRLCHLSVFERYSEHTLLKILGNACGR